MLTVGDILKQRYRIDSFLGRGGMADVYLAFDLRRQTHLAIKVLREDLAEDPEFVRRFQREGEALARLDHPFVVRFYAFEVDSPLAFIVMDYVPGSTLRRRLSDIRGPLPLEEVTQILRQVGAALQYAHNEEYIHRDVKPGNVMLREDGAALLSDFGIARTAETTTMTISLVGTPAYMSPEQFLGKELDPRTDIYSLGVVLFETVTGKRPFSGEQGTGSSTIDRVRDAHLHLLPPDPRALNPTLPPAVSALVLRALEKDPAARWPDVQSLIRAWETALGLEHETVTGGRPVNPFLVSQVVSLQPPAPAATRNAQGQLAPAPRRPWAAVAGVVGVTLIALFALRMVLVSAPAPTATPAPILSVDTPTALATPDLESTAQVLAQNFAAQTARAEAAISAAARGTVEAAGRATAAAQEATAIADNATATTEAAAAIAALATAAAEETRVVIEAAQIASARSTEAATAATRAAQLTRAARPTRTPQPTSLPRPTQPRERCFVGRLRQFEWAGGGVSIGGEIRDRNGQLIPNMSLRLYVKGGNYEVPLLAPDGRYSHCCLSFGYNLNVVELTGTNIRMLSSPEVQFLKMSEDRALVDFTEVACP